VLDVHTLDLRHLVEEQVEEVGVGDVHGELVDCPTGTPFDDVDADHVALDRTDPTGHGAERTRSVREPDTEDVGGHGRTLVAACDGLVSGA
jgi:hypothetical protein